MTFAAPLRSDCVDSGSAIAALGRLRVQASLRLDVQHIDGRTRLTDLGENGGYRIKFPDASPDLDAVIVNTGGGLLGGDAFALSVNVKKTASLSITTQSAEKVYQALDAPSRVDVRLTLEEGAKLHWIPQETILFSGAGLERSICADIASDSELLIAESVTFGRLAMGESMIAGSLKDRWRISRDGQLIYADDFKLAKNMAAKLDRPAIGGGARAIGIVLLVSPDAESRLEMIRASVDQESVDIGASAWNGKLILRMMAADPEYLRCAMVRVLEIIRGCPVPRNW
jgi:urease accessory protein